MVIVGYSKDWCVCKSSHTDLYLYLLCSSSLIKKCEEKLYLCCVASWYHTSSTVLAATLFETLLQHENSLNSVLPSTKSTSKACVIDLNNINTTYVSSPMFSFHHTAPQLSQMSLFAHKRRVKIGKRAQPRM